MGRKEEALQVDHSTMAKIGLRSRVLTSVRFSGITLVAAALLLLARYFLSRSVGFSHGSVRRVDFFTFQEADPYKPHPLIVTPG